MSPADCAEGSERLPRPPGACPGVVQAPDRLGGARPGVLPQLPPPRSVACTPAAPAGAALAPAPAAHLFAASQRPQGALDREVRPCGAAAAQGRQAQPAARLHWCAPAPAPAPDPPPHPRRCGRCPAQQDPSRAVLPPAGEYECGALVKEINKKPTVRGRARARRAGPRRIASPAGSQPWGACPPHSAAPWNTHSSSAAVLPGTLHRRGPTCAHKRRPRSLHCPPPCSAAAADARPDEEHARGAGLPRHQGGAFWCCSAVLCSSAALRCAQLCRRSQRRAPACRCAMPRRAQAGRPRAPLPPPLCFSPPPGPHHGACGKHIPRARALCACPRRRQGGGCGRRPAGGGGCGFAALGCASFALPVRPHTCLPACRRRKRARAAHCKHRSLWATFARLFWQL